MISFARHLWQTSTFFCLSAGVLRKSLECRVLPKRPDRPNGIAELAHRLTFDSIQLLEQPFRTHVERSAWLCVVGPAVIAVVKTRTGGAAFERSLLAVTTATRRWSIDADPYGKSYVLLEPGAQGAVGGATLLLMRLANQADKDLAVQVVLNRPVMSRVHGEVWPDASSKDKDAYFAGYHRAVGRYR